MSNFCILRIKKLHTNANVGGALSHHLRTRETDNADPERLERNFFLPSFFPKDTTFKESVKNIELRKKWQNQAMSMYKKRLPEKVRKNGVRAVELMMTMSPEAMQKKDFNPVRYLHDCHKWAKEKFGAENVFFAGWHFDEKTPHISILLTPIDEKGKLNARSYFGGREKMTALQDEFYEKVGKKHDLDRGIKGSKAKHQTIKQYYEKQNQKDLELEKLAEDISQNLPQKKFGQTAEKYEQEKEQFIQDKLKPIVRKTIVAEQTDKRLKGLQENFETLVQTKTNCAVAEKTEQIRAEKENLERKLNQDNITIKYPDGVEIPCINGIINGLRERADNALQFRSLTTEGVKALAERMEKMNIKSADEVLKLAKNKGMDIADYLDSPIEKKRTRGYGGMSMSD